MPPIRRGRRAHPRVQAKSHYETPIIKILVGEDEATFMVNEGLLQGTSFFTEHGRPKSRSPTPQQIPSAPPTPRNEQDSRCMSNNQSGLFFDDASGFTMDSDDDAITIDLTDADAHYELKGKFYYTRDAFTILIRHLNDALPETPQNQQECWALFKAYALAQHYHVERLQNQVIDALQRFYAANTIPITDVIYVIQHWGDTIDCFLVGYLVAQTGYEMALDWAKYRSENDELVNLFESHNKVVIEQLFQAAMQHSKPTPAADPAKHKRDWRLA